ncbi:MAG: R2-like ligand-binding oxidase [Acidobacteriota bacterium]
MTTTREFKTLTHRGLDHRLPPMRLWQKAKKIGIWNPQDIDFRQDAEDWKGLEPLEQDVILRLTTLFQAGEESVTLDLLPLIMVMAEEGRLEEEMYLTSFLWEEAKHVEAFRRFVDEVVGDPGDLTRFESPSYQQIFHHELPAALGRLRGDSSPVAQAEASVTYNMIVEGVLAETGYHAYHSILERHDLMPGMRRVVAHLKSDEARHMAYGVYLLSRLVAEHGDDVWKAIEDRMGNLLPLAIGVVNETFDAYDVPPFGLTVDEFVTFAMSQFQRRIQRVEKARSQTLDEVNRVETEVEAKIQVAAPASI